MLKRTVFKAQVNARLNPEEFMKLREFSYAENLSISRYASIIIENYLNDKQLQRKLKKSLERG
jgi:hypothetical protein